MTIDVDALAKAASKDTADRERRLDLGNTLGIHAELNAAFLCGWRYAMRSKDTIASDPNEGKP